jgi:hypothetical protein
LFWKSRLEPLVIVWMVPKGRKLVFYWEDYVVCCGGGCVLGSGFG